MNDYGIEKISLFDGNSDLVKLNYKIKDINIYMKRDDLIPYAFGGNKVRLFEYIAKCIIDSGCRVVLTYGSVYSNFLRVVAVVCEKLGLECHLICLGNENSCRNRANQKLVGYTNAKISYCEESDAHAFIEEYQKSLGQANRDYYWIPGGGHLAEASFGYVDASKELISQIENYNVQIDAVFIPCGTGTSQSGLIYGMNDSNIDIYGITVARSVSRCKEEIEDTLSKMNFISNRNKTTYKINVLENDLAKYGTMNDEIEELIADVVKSDGVYLDPIYNAKSFCRMKHFLEDSKEFHNVVYVNTGGSPNLFL